MKLNNALIAATFATAACTAAIGTWAAQSDAETPVARPSSAAPVATAQEQDETALRPLPEEQVLEFLQIAPREPLPKVAQAELRFTPATTGRLVVKFRDEARVRLTAQGQVMSRSNADIGDVKAILQHFGARLQPAFQKSEQRLRNIEVRAAIQSQRGQPDLAGMMYITGDVPADLEQVAKALNQLDIVEFVEMEPILATPGGGAEPGACCYQGTIAGTSECFEIQEESCESLGGYWIGGECASTTLCADAGACCVSEGTCEFRPAVFCADVDMTYIGTGISCADPAATCEEPDCGVAGTGDCFDDNGSLYCDDEDCCEAVCDIDPFCCEEDAPVPPLRPGPPNWDIECALLAFQVCAGGNVCGGLSGSCFETHPGAGCNDAACCTDVCTLEPFCCQTQWDAVCVGHALDLCSTGSSGTPTPSFTDAQGYLTAAGYASIPNELAGCIPENGPNVPVRGYGGHGMDLDSLTAMGDVLHNQYGLGEDNLARGGATIRVGVVEFNCNPDHQELKDVLTVEPGQTLLTGVLEDNHGTACLGIIGAEDDGAIGPGADERGIVGIAPEAELWFFPIVSVEQPGGRLYDAMASAFEIFEPGDVLSFSIGPANACGTLPSRAADFTMLSLGRDLGITCCIAAGNQCCNLDDAPQFGGGDCGCIIVGACTPGAPFCRLGFSNHCQNCGADSDVHTSAWGTCVMTLGYGDVFFQSANRSYGTFSGTSAATPQIAGMIARLQGLAKMFYGIPLPPEYLRAVLPSGYPQCLILNEADRPGAQDEFPCVGDNDFDATPNLIEFYSQPSAVATAMMESGFFDGNPNLEDILLVKGKYVYGNRTSILGVDGSYFVATSEYTERRRGGGHAGAHNGTAAAAANAVYYFSAGQVVDVIATGRLQNAFASSLTVQAVVKSPSVTSGNVAVEALVFLDIWDWNAGRWVLADFTLVPANAGLDFLVTSTVGAAQRYINASGEVLARVHSEVPGGPQSQGASQLFGAGTYPFLIDLIAIDADETFAFPVPIGGGVGGGGGGL